jgi:ribosomal protein S18 acetylase RimI-like enzyme
MTYRIERGAPSHAERLREIERASSIHFREIGMADVADHEPTPASILEDSARDGLLYVALTADTVAGFLIWSAVDDEAYIEEVAVDPAHAGHRLAARMIDRLAQDIRGRHPAITLATFRDVPWNGPYYAKLGFEEFPHDQVGPDHAKAWQEQSDIGLDMSKRLFMIRRVGP